MAFAMCGIAIAVAGVWDVISVWLPHSGPLASHFLSTLWRAASWIALSFACLYWLTALHRRAETIRVLGRYSRSTAAAMERLARASRHEGQVAGGRPLLFLVGAVGVVLLVAFRDPRALSFVALAAGLLFWLRLRISSPPFLLLLSTSTHEAVQRHFNYKRFATPLRVISLLETTGRLEEKLTAELELDCLRTANDDDWFVAVRVLAEIAPILVLDATATTVGVLREYKHVLDEQLEYKSVFISASDGECALMSALEDRRASPESLCVADDEDALRIIDGVLVAGELPTPERPIGGLTARRLPNASTPGH